VEYNYYNDEIKISNEMIVCLGFIELLVQGV
jgi:hypothetical protein